MTIVSTTQCSRALSSCPPTAPTSHHPWAQGWLPDIVGLLVAGQHSACNGLLQVLSLPPQDLLEVIFQGLYHITQKKDSPRQILSLWEKKMRRISSQFPDDSESWALINMKSKGRPCVNKYVCT